MIRYNKDNQAYKLVSVSRFNNRPFARVERLHSDEQKIIEYKDFESGNFSFEKAPLMAVPVNDDKPILYKVEPAQIVETINKTVEATTPRGKTLTFDLTDIESFCANYKLDVEAVKMVLTGAQKTHRKWGFVLVD